MNKLALSTLLLLQSAALALGCVGQRPPSTGSQASSVVMVQVRNYKEEPVSSATVTVRSESLANPLVRRTDASGQLRLTLAISLAPLTVEVTKNGFNMMLRRGIPLKTSEVVTLSYHIERNEVIERMKKTTIK